MKAREHTRATIAKGNTTPKQDTPPDAVLITRPEPGAGRTAAKLEALGFVPVVAPVLRIRPLPFRLPGGRIAAVLLTSASAVDPLPSTLHAVPLLTVGSATARRAEAAGFGNVASADGNATDLAAMVRARVPRRNGALLLACGQGQSLSLAAELRAAGYRVLRRVVYAAVPVPRLPETARTALAGERLRAVLFFSAETARHFMRLTRAEGLVARLRRLDAITIGTPAGMALEAEHWARVRVAGKPTQDEMLALLR
jgi:uroporphyrinogen-III synthase